MSPTRRSRRVYKITEKGERFRQEGFRGLDHLLPRDIGKVRLLRQQAPQGTGGENARKILETVTVR